MAPIPTRKRVPVMRADAEVRGAASQAAEVLPGDLACVHEVLQRLGNVDHPGPRALVPRELGRESAGPTDPTNPWLRIATLRRWRHSRSATGARGSTLRCAPQAPLEPEPKWEDG